MEIVCHDGRLSHDDDIEALMRPLLLRTDKAVCRQVRSAFVEDAKKNEVADVRPNSRGECVAFHFDHVWPRFVPDEENGGAVYLASVGGDQPWN